MKHLKLFEEMKINPTDLSLSLAAKYGHDISTREKRILTDLVGDYIENFYIKVDDNYYYVNNNNVYYNRFDNFSELKDYVLSHYYMYDGYMYEGKSEEYLELLKRSNLDPSFDNNATIRWACYHGQLEIGKLLLKDPRVHPCLVDNLSIWWASRNGHKAVVKLLLKDPRVKSKLTEEEITKYTLKLFEEMKIDQREFPFDGHNLSPREIKILTDLVAEYLTKFDIKVEDYYYYVNYGGIYNVFDDFNELKEYVLLWYYIDNNIPEEFLELLKTSKLDPSFDNNCSIKWAIIRGHIEIVRLLLKDHRVDPSVLNNYLIEYANRNRRREIVKLLLNDSRVRDKLTQEQINKYTNESS
jgi:hypothetical protein